MYDDNPEVVKSLVLKQFEEVRPQIDLWLAEKRQEGRESELKAEVRELEEIKSDFSELKLGNLYYETHTLRYLIDKIHDILRQFPLNDPKDVHQTAPENGDFKEDPFRARPSPPHTTTASWGTFEFDDDLSNSGVGRGMGRGFGRGQRLSSEGDRVKQEMLDASAKILSATRRTAQMPDWLKEEDPQPSTSSFERRRRIGPGAVYFEGDKPKGNGDWLEQEKIREKFPWEEEAAFERRPAPVPPPSETRDGRRILYTATSGRALGSLDSEQERYSFNDFYDGRREPDVGERRREETRRDEGKRRQDSGSRSSPSDPPFERRRGSGIIGEGDRPADSRPPHRLDDRGHRDHRSPQDRHQSRLHHESHDRRRTHDERYRERHRSSEGDRHRTPRPSPQTSPPKKSPQSGEAPRSNVSPPLPATRPKSPPVITQDVVLKFLSSLQPSNQVPSPPGGAVPQLNGYSGGIQFTSEPSSPCFPLQQPTMNFTSMNGPNPFCQPNMPSPWTPNPFEVPPPPPQFPQVPPPSIRPATGSFKSPSTGARQAPPFQKAVPPRQSPPPLQPPPLPPQFPPVVINAHNTSRVQNHLPPKSPHNTPSPQSRLKHTPPQGSRHATSNTAPPVSSISPPISRPPEYTAEQLREITRQKAAQCFGQSGARPPNHSKSQSVSSYHPPPRTSSNPRGPVSTSHRPPAPATASSRSQPHPSRAPLVPTGSPNVARSSLPPPANPRDLEIQRRNELRARMMLKHPIEEDPRQKRKCSRRKTDHNYLTTN